jgi:organic hydroperoxide reductase OsmC/OhrA
MTEEHRFAATASWSPAEKEGDLENGDRSFATRFAGAPSLGGKPGLVNPEELLVSATLACFVQTWAIFLQKIKVPIERPKVFGSCEVGKDPAGGYRVVKITFEPSVPAAIWAERRVDVEKTLALAERYCIVSKAVKGEGRSLVVAPRVE